MLHICNELNYRRTFRVLGLGLVMAHVKRAGCHKLEDAAFHMEDFPCELKPTPVVLTRPSMGCSWSPGSQLRWSCQACSGKMGAGKVVFMVQFSNTRVGWWNHMYATCSTLFKQIRTCMSGWERVWTERAGRNGRMSAASACKHTNPHSANTALHKQQSRGLKSIRWAVSR